MGNPIPAWMLALSLAFLPSQAWTGDNPPERLPTTIDSDSGETRRPSTRWLLSAHIIAIMLVFGLVLILSGRLVWMV